MIIAAAKSSSSYYYASAAGYATTSIISSSSDTETCRRSNSSSFLIPPLDPHHVDLIQTDCAGATILPLDPIGAIVYGIDLRRKQQQQQPLSEACREALEAEMASRGFLVFKGQSKDMTVDDWIAATTWWGGRTIQSTHSVHPATPNKNRHIFRLSNDNTHGIVGVGPQWHNDGSFLAAPFSHVGYHMIRVPNSQGAGTHFAHQGAAFDTLPKETQEYWRRLSSVNSNSGVVHPVVHVHPISKRESVWLHLGMTGAVIEQRPKNEGGYRLLNDTEMRALLHDYNNLLDQGMKRGYTIDYEYDDGDCLFIDNYAVAHRAAPEAHQPPTSEQGLRILHRTTAKAPFESFPPLAVLPQVMDIHGPSPFENDDGVWLGGGVGFRWDESLHFQN